MLFLHLLVLLLFSIFCLVHSHNNRTEFDYIGRDNVAAVRSTTALSPRSSPPHSLLARQEDSSGSSPSKTIGVIGAIVGILSFAFNFFDPKAPDPNQTILRIAVVHKYDDEFGVDGLPVDPAGDLPHIRIWDDARNFLGEAKNAGHIDAGTFKDISIHQDAGNQQAPYALLSAKGDDICIAYVTAKWADG